MKKKYEVQEINIDLINELRLNGNRVQATELLRAFRKDVNKNKKQLLKETFRQDRLIQKHHKICVNLHCGENAVEGHTLCEECLMSHRKSKRNRYKKEFKVNKYLMRRNISHSKDFRITYYISVSKTGEIYENIF